MRAELRSDGLHISGYVNVPGRASRPVYTPRGRVIEVIEQRAFADAINRAENIQMLLDHDRDRVLASTADGTLKVEEDAVGLRAESVVADDGVIAAARAGKLRGWSFDMRNVKDEIEQRAEGELPVRHVKSFDMSEITLVVNRNPLYCSTSIEVRADMSEGEVEERALDVSAEYAENLPPKPSYDNSQYHERLKKLKGDV